jgi:phenylpropionate dioxygenase-like ring-hydroxylating dioxygenase large terminal subunit
MVISTKTLLASDVEIVRRVLAHVDARTTDEGDTWREPVEHYVDPRRFSEELKLLRSSPSVFVPSATIPNPGDHVERAVFGVPLFAVRDRDGHARVFRNACRHRGVALVEGAGCSRALVCPYHGWTYRLDGSLAHVPHADGFPDLDASARGLVEVASREVDGLIVIDGVEPSGGDWDTDVPGSALAALMDGSPWRRKLMPATRCFNVTSIVRAMNWKVLVEQFLEGYHIRSTHRETFFPVQYDNLNVIETFGPNSRITYPYRNIERLRDRPESTWTVDRRVTFLYQLFPNVMLATFPDRVMMIVVDPVDVDHSTLTTYSMADPAVISVDELASTPVDRDADAPGPRSLIDQGAVEDNAMSTAVQRGLHAGANSFVEFGRHESAIGHFHRALDDRLARLADQPVRVAPPRDHAAAR